MKNIIKSTSKFWLFTAMFVAIIFTSCEEEFIPETDASQQEIVVEGYVEVGNGANPTFVILTKSIPFISTISQDKFAELFVKGASVTVNDGDKDVALTELCLNDIPPALREEVYALLGFNADSLAVDICVYADILGLIKKDYGRKYDLKVIVEGKTLTASTTTPEFVPLYGFRWEDTPGVSSDSLARLFVTINDPGGVNNFYRYFTAQNDSPLIPPFGSVTNDAIFGGQEFEFPLQKAERRDRDFDPESFGYYSRGDSVLIKWCTIDEPHFNFWNTRDFSANSGGPFAAYTRIATNINGGLGIWGGYSVDTYRLFAPPK